MSRVKTTSRKKYLFLRLEGERPLSPNPCSTSQQVTSRDLASPLTLSLFLLYSWKGKTSIYVGAVRFELTMFTLWERFYRPLRHRRRRRTPVSVLLFNYRRRGPGWTCSAFFQTCQRSSIFCCIDETRTHVG